MQNGKSPLSEKSTQYWLAKVRPTNVGLFLLHGTIICWISINWAVQIMLKIEIHVDSVFHFLTMIQ